MKKLLLLLMLFPALSFAFKDTIKSGGLWSVLTWSTGAPPTTSDTVYKVGGPFNDTMNADYTIAAFVCIATTAGTHWRNGYTLTCTGALGFSDKGTGTRHYGTGLTLTANNAVLTTESTLGTITSATCLLTIGGTGTSIVNNKDFRALSITLSASATATVTGTAPIYCFQGTLTLGNNSSLTITQEGTNYLEIWPIITGAPIVLGTGVTWSGITGCRISPEASNRTITIPTIAYTGSGGWIFQNGGGITGTIISLNGALNLSSAELRVSCYPTLYTFLTNGNAITCGDFIFGPNGAGTVFKGGFSASTVNCRDWNNTTYNAGSSFDTMGTITVNATRNVSLGANHNYINNNSLFNLSGTGAQTITSNGKQFNNLTVNNSGTATVKFADFLSLIGDLTLTDGRDSIGRSQCQSYYNNTNDSVFHTDTTIINVSYYRNNAKVSRVGGKLSFRDGADGTINLVDAGTMGPISIRKTGGHKMTALSAIRANRVLDTTGVLKMGVYALACTTLTVRDTGLQLAAVTLDTMHSYKGGTIGGGTITRWNWLADGIRHLLAAGTTLTIGSVSGIGGTAGHPDTLRSGTPGSRATATKPKDTVPYLSIIDIVSTNGTYLPATSTSDGNNQHVYTLSYTGVTKDVAIGIVGTMVTFTGYGFVGACWVKFGTDSSALTVASYTSASIAVPAGLAPGVYAVTVGNIDGDIASVGNFTVTAAPSTGFSKMKKFFKLLIIK